MFTNDSATFRKEHLRVKQKKNASEACETMLNVENDSFGEKSTNCSRY